MRARFPGCNGAEGEKVMDCSKKGLTSNERFNFVITSRAEPSRAEPSRAEPLSPPRLREQRRPPSPPDRRPAAGFRAPARRGRVRSVRALLVTLAMVLPGASNAQDSVDRAALVALYNMTGGASWTNNTNWLSNEALSEWHGVQTDANGRVTHVSLSENRLSGAIPVALGNLTSLQQLRLNSNELSGPLPLTLSALSQLSVLHIQSTTLCAPADTAFQAWLATINDFQGEGVCPLPPAARIRNVTVVNGPGSDGVWSTGERVELEVRYNKPVVVEQPDCWSYNADGTCRPPGPYVAVVFRDDERPGYGKVKSVALVPYAGGSGTDRLRFSYSVGAAKAGARGVEVADGTLLLRGATIRTIGGGDGKPEFTRTRVLQANVQAPSGAWTAGDTVRVQVTFTGPEAAPGKKQPNRDEVVVDKTRGTPSIGLVLGDRENRPLARTASYKRGSRSNTLTFEYEVTAGDGRVSAVEVVADSLALNGATIRNEQGYDAELDHLGTVRHASLALRVRDAGAAREGGTLAFTMELAQAPKAPVTVDYETKRGTVTFAPGRHPLVLEPGGSVAVLRPGRRDLARRPGPDVDGRGRLSDGAVGGGPVVVAQPGPGRLRGS